MYWTIFTQELKWISAGSAVWGVKNDGTIVRHDANQNAWIAYPPVAAGKTVDKVFCGNDDTVLALESDTGLCYRYNYLMNVWYPFGGAVNSFKQLGIADNRLIYGVTSEKYLYRYFGENRTVDIAHSTLDVAAATDGTLMTVSDAGTITRYINDKQISGIFANAKLICLQSAAHLMYTNTDNQIFYYIGESYSTTTQNREKYWDNSANGWRYRDLPIQTETGIFRMTIAATGTCYIQILDNDNTINTYRMIPMPPEGEDIPIEPEYVKLKVEEYGSPETA